MNPCPLILTLACHSCSETRPLGASPIPHRLILSWPDAIPPVGVRLAAAGASWEHGTRGITDFREHQRIAESLAGVELRQLGFVRFGPVGSMEEVFPAAVLSAVILRTATLGTAELQAGPKLMLARGVDTTRGTFCQAYFAGAGAGLAVAFGKVLLVPGIDAMAGSAARLCGAATTSAGVIASLTVRVLG